MNFKRALGVILLAISACVLLYANYQEGRIRDASADANAKIKKGQELFDGNPATEGFGSAVGKAAKKKVGSEVAKYQQMVMWLKTGGIAIGVVGLGILVLARNPRSRG